MGKVKKITLHLYYQLHDGDSIDSSELLRHCGSALPSPIVWRSSGNSLTVRFNADTSVSSRGFQANFTTVSYGNKMPHWIIRPFHWQMKRLHIKHCGSCINYKILKGLGCIKKRLVASATVFFRYPYTFSFTFESTEVSFGSWCELRGSKVVFHISLY